MNRVAGPGLALAVAASLLPGCPAGGQGVDEPRPASSGVLASVRRSETMHNGMGSSVWSVTVRDDGAVDAERESNGERAVLRCPPLDPAATAELTALVQAARDAGLEPRYDRSALPEPQANYSPSRTIVLGGGGPLEVQVVGWADAPSELTAVEERLDAAAAGCAETEPAASDEGCYRSDPADIYRSVHLCLGPPEAEPGGFVLHESQTVPDATLSATWTGSVAPSGDGLVLRAEWSRSQTVNEQLGTTSGGPEAAATRKWRLLRAAPSGGQTLRAEDGSELVLYPE
ncbi:MAG: hypothetical protein JXB32_08295 [Deltaproteobacteria bacterium]|nr:hypothetical protein [Deltaproteobacteria bacterium]